MVAQTTQAIDPAKVEAFAGRMLQVLNGGMLSLLISVGHQTGLFETLAGLHPAPRRRSRPPPGYTSATCVSG